MAQTLSVATGPASAQDDVRSERSKISDQIKERREKEMRDWTQKGEAYMKQQDAIAKKHAACSAQAKAQKLHFAKSGALS